MVAVAIFLPIITHMRDESSIYNKPGNVTRILREAEAAEHIDPRIDEPMMPLLEITYPGVEFGPKDTVGPPYSRADFRRAFDALCAGNQIKTQLEFDRTLPPWPQFQKYVRRDPELREEYREAKRICAEWCCANLMDIASGKDEHGDPTLEDTARSALRVNTSLKLMGFYDREAYGERKQVDITQNIRVDNAMEAAIEKARSRAEKVINPVPTPAALPNPDSNAA